MLMLLAKFKCDRWIHVFKNKELLDKIPLKRDASGPEGYSDTSGLVSELCIV